MHQQPSAQRKGVGSCYVTPNNLCYVPLTVKAHPSTSADPISAALVRQPKSSQVMYRNSLISTTRRCGFEAPDMHLCQCSECRWCMIVHTSCMRRGIVLSAGTCRASMRAKTSRVHSSASSVATECFTCLPRRYMCTLLGTARAHTKGKQGLGLGLVYTAG